MKRSSLMFALLTVIASVAGAATPAQTATPLPALAALPAMTSAAPPACDTNRTQLGIPVFMNASKATTCGSCSDTKCQGSQLHEVCFGPGPSGSYHCENAYGNFCSGIVPQCQCWTGPLP